MRRRTRKLITRGAAVAGAGVLLGWPTYAAVAWARYGRRRRDEEGRDPLLDRALPRYDVAEMHQTRVAAPADVVWAAAMATPMQQSKVVRALIRTRERLMRAHGGNPWPRGGLVAQMRASGWSKLEEHGGEVVLGTVTQPWRGDVRFESLTPEEFAEFYEPGYVKIVVAIAVEPVGPEQSILRVRTRVLATGARARARFRRYWAAFSPGIMLIRRALLRVIKREAVRRHRAAGRRASLVPMTPARA